MLQFLEEDLERGKHLAIGMIVRNKRNNGRHPTPDCRVLQIDADNHRALVHRYGGDDKELWVPCENLQDVAQLANAFGSDNAQSTAKSTQMMLSDFWRPESIADYKIHFARYNGEEQPLYAFARGMKEWQGWQQWYPSKNDFNRPYVFSLMQMPDQPDLWMFGGIWNVNGIKRNEQGRKFYDVDLSDELQPLVGRLKLHRVHKGRGTRLRLEGHYDYFVLSEILPEKFTGREFPGYRSVHIGFQELEALINNNRQDWSAALRYVKGIYLITDTHSQRRYVGSAYGEWGIWSRWQTYVQLGHGGNQGMRELLKCRDLDYCRQNFKFALLEHHDASVEDQLILDREIYWKQVLDTRHAVTGMNKN